MDTNNLDFLKAVINGESVFFENVYVDDLLFFKNKKVGIIINSFYRQSIKLSIFDREKELLICKDSSFCKERNFGTKLILNIKEIESYLIDQIDDSLIHIELILKEKNEIIIEKLASSNFFDFDFLNKNQINLSIEEVSYFILALNIIISDFYDERNYWIINY